MRLLFFNSFVALIILSCTHHPSSSSPSVVLKSDPEVTSSKVVTSTHEIVDATGNTVQTRINPPKGYKRVPKPVKSFASYLRNLPLKPHGAEVKLFDGGTKPYGNVYMAVIDLPIGKKDLHQCADAIMRLRAEYLWNEKRYDEIHFNLTNGFKVDYKYWMEGKRVAVKGNKTYWVDKGLVGNSYADFWSYMEFIFTYAGTLSLSKELIPVRLENMQIGDVFIWGGSPGHAVLVIDMAQNGKGDKVFMLAQSYMPAQETQILLNPNNYQGNPWYEVSELMDELYTPEWQFDIDDLKRF